MLTGTTENPHLSCLAKLTHSSHTHSCSELIDSGAEQNFFDETLAQKLGLPLILLPEPLQVSALNGTQLANVTHRTQEIQLTLSGNHVEMVSLFLFRAPSTTLVLGYPWLQQHNPQINPVNVHNPCATNTACNQLFLALPLPNQLNS